MENGDIPENANEHCPGPQSESAGKSDSCEGCPNQQICATAPKGPDPVLSPTMDTTCQDARSDEGNTAPVARNVRPGITERSPLERTVNFLLDSIRIGTFYYNVPKYRRYVDLKRNQIFNSLVNLYTQIFAAHWTHIRMLVETFPLGPEFSGNHQRQRYAAAVYITAWFHDLYVSNRVACRKLCDSAYTEHYFLDIVHKSLEYDVFLARLNGQIRPTNIKGTHEDTLFIPRINATVDENGNNRNYFGITGWTINETCLQGILYILKDRKILKFEPLPDNTIGRPSWLFDWHDDCLAYAWFQSNNNYTFEDVTFAYIIGEACTPKLGPRDHDEWQIFPGNITPLVIDPAAYNRVRPLAYHGAVEYRIIETRNFVLPHPILQLFQVSNTTPPLASIATLTGGTGPQALTAPPTRTTRKQTSASYQTRSKKKKTKDDQTSAIADSETEHQAEEESLFQPETTQTPDATTQPLSTSTGTTTILFPPIAQYRIVDYLYHARVVLNNDVHSRIAALRQIIY